MTWLSQIPFLKGYEDFLLCGLFVAILLILYSLISRKNPEENDILPNPRPTLYNFIELIVEFNRNLVHYIAGREGDKYTPFVAAVFIYILAMNLLGLIPGFIPPTSNINVNAGAAFFVFLYYNYTGFRAHGISYLKHFLGPIKLMAPMFLLIELVSHVFRPVTLSIRLFGNMFSDHMVLEIFQHLIPVGVPAIFLFMALIVAFVQAFVFAMLTAIYIGLAIAHE